MGCCGTPQRGPALARAAVFGAQGFLGGALTRRLLAAGTLVFGIDTRPWPGAPRQGYRHSAGAEAALPEAAAFLGEDAGKGPRAFFHMAGLADARACQLDPERARRLNVDLVARALAALDGVRAAFVFPSTGIVYGDRLDRPAREDDPLLPAAEYARGKITAEGLVRAACAKGPLCAAIARLSNIYGPAGGENTVLGRLLAQARRGEPLHVFDETPVRDFLHLDDAAEGLIRLGLAACALRGPERTITANLSTGEGVSVGQLVDLCAELFHSSRLAPEHTPPADARASSLVLDNARLAALTGWRPGVTLRRGLQDSIATT